MNNEQKLKQFTNKIAEDSAAHSSIPFWSWNDKLEHDELLAQIENMNALGMRGFFMHARGGLETEYLSEEWFDAIRFCVEQAKKRGMEAWSYDENGWPSGFAGGELLKDPKNHIAGVDCEEVDAFPQLTDDILGVYTMTDEGVIRHTKDVGANRYIVVRRKTNFCYVDTMDPEITKQFIELTHARYEREVGEEFGKTMPGFFTDEPQYFRYGVPWSDTFHVKFKEKYGYDVLDGLPALFYKFKGSREFRYDYYYLCHESLINGFVKPIYEWCDEHGVGLTGHTIEEWTLKGQMMCCGGVMPFYRYEHIPGIDYLSRNLKDISGAKQLGSVCEQIGRKVALSEMFACCGWDVTPRELKRIAELQFSGGVNLICEHLYAYSMRGQRKRDFPNFYSPHNPWQKHYGAFERHFKNLGSALSQGRELADTLVIHPIHSAYLDFRRYDEDCIKELEEKYAELTATLTRDQILFHFGDETIMRDLGAVEGAKIRVGKCVYDKVVIPYCYTLDRTTVEMLREYLENGGKLYMAYGAPDRIDGRVADLSFLKSNMTYEELKASSGIDVKCDGESVPLNIQVRATDIGRVIFLANTSAKVYGDITITVRDCKGLEEICPETLERRPVRGKRNADGSVSVLLYFGDSTSALLVESDAQMLAFEKSEPKRFIALDKPFYLDGHPENMITLDTARVALDGGEYSEERPVVRIKDNLLYDRFAGKVSMKYTFESETLPSSMRLVIEPMKYISVTVNGTPVTLTKEWRIDDRFLSADIAALVRKGTNNIELCFDYFQRDYVYHVLYGGTIETLRNCLVFDTEVECVYLYGDFCVRSSSEIYDCERGTVRTKGPFVLTARTDKINACDIVRDGYPFFAGEMTFVTSFEHKAGDPTAIKLGGRFATASVRINGNALPTALFTDEFELGEYLVKGENELKITVCFSNRNLLGPHHRQDAELNFVVPRSFSFEKAWDGADCPDYVEDHAFVKFGILS